MEKQKTFFGHPMGLSTLFFTEMWERFSYYGMRAILLYYMYYSVQDGGLGMDKTTAASVMAIYGSLVFLSSVVGGFVSDRILGSRKTVFYGGILIMLGHIALATPFGQVALYLSIALIIFGTGFLKPNISDMVGGIYEKEDDRRDAGFSIFVFGINLGAFVAPYLVGYLGQEVNFHLGFSLAAIGMLFGTDVKVSPFWLIMSWAIVIVGEMLISPIGLSVTTKLAPKSFQAQMMSIWFLSNAAAQAINAQIVKFYTSETEVAYYGIVGGITIVFGIILLFYVPRIEKLMSGIK